MTTFDHEMGENMTTCYMDDPLNIYLKNLIVYAFKMFRSSMMVVALIFLNFFSLINAGD